MNIIIFDTEFFSLSKKKSSIIKKIFDDKRVFSGNITNKGVRRADFARAVFYLWDQNTNLIASDSSFINSTTIQYSSGIVTDCAIEPSTSANYSVSVSSCFSFSQPARFLQGARPQNLPNP